MGGQHRALKSSILAMPPRVPLSGRHSARALPQLTANAPYICPTCALGRYTSTNAKQHRTRSPQTRAASAASRSSRPQQAFSQVRASPLQLPRSHCRYVTTLASNTAINPPTLVLPENRDLYSSLQTLKNVASDHVNQSRLQLALHSLESGEPTIRIGILGLGAEGERAARKLARVLLADPLEQETGWETALREQEDSQMPLLLKFGDEEDVQPYNPLLETRSVSSRVLKRHRLEILITTLNAGTNTSYEADTAALEEAILVPPLQTPIASTGRAGFVRYPVHKALVIGSGIQGCMAIGRLSPLLGSAVEDNKELMRATINMPYSSQTDVKKESINIDQADEALKIFRQDIANGSLFNEKWQTSNVAALSQWLSSSPPAPSTLDSAVSGLITSIVNSTSTAINNSETTAKALITTQTIPDATRAHLQSAITNWAQHAHTDLQTSLPRGFASRAWRRTSWTRLLWRVDDVGVAGEEVVRSHWLLDAEAGLAFLAGRVEEAGFFRSGAAASRFAYNPDWALSAADRALDKDGQAMSMERSYLAAPAPTSTTTTSTTTVQEPARNPGLFSSLFAARAPRPPSTADLLQTATNLAPTIAAGGIDILATRPWPLAIHYTRAKLLHALVPALQARAQALLLQTLSALGVSGAAAAWILAATGGTGAYEAGAVGALGAVWSLRRLQRAWEGARDVFEGEVGEQGRVVLAEVEGVMRGVVRGNERGSGRAGDVEGWERAREAVGRVREEVASRRHDGGGEGRSS